MCFQGGGASELKSDFSVWSLEFDESGTTILPFREQDSFELTKNSRSSGKSYAQQWLVRCDTTKTCLAMGKTTLHLENAGAS